MIKWVSPLVLVVNNIITGRNNPEIWMKFRNEWRDADEVLFDCEDCWGRQIGFSFLCLFLFPTAKEFYAIAFFFCFPLIGRISVVCYLWRLLLRFRRRNIKSVQNKKIISVSRNQNWLAYPWYQKRQLRYGQNRTLFGHF